VPSVVAPPPAPFAGPGAHDLDLPPVRGDLGMTSRTIWMRRSRAVRCYAAKHPSGDLVTCRPGGPDSKTKVVFETRDAARRAAEVLALVDPQGAPVKPCVCRLRDDDGVRHFHLRSVVKVAAYKRRRKARKASRGQDLGVTEGGQKMAEKTTEARTYECDAAKCDVTHVCVGDQEPKGIRLTAEVADEKPVTAYACKPTHIRPAVEAVLAAQAQPADVEPERGDDDPRTDGERDTDEQFDIARSNGDTTHADRVDAEEDVFESAGAPA
jgi:hypothetical protein